MIGGLEQIVLLATLRLGDDAYAVSVRREIEARSGKRVARGALYTVLERLEEKGCLSSRLGTPTAARGGRPKRFYKVTPSGVRALKGSREAIVRLWQGLESVLGKLS
jgi:PadR family transcriptional regulator